jgi:hypothetical protein
MPLAPQEGARAAQQRHGCQQRHEAPRAGAEQLPGVNVDAVQLASDEEEQRGSHVARRHTRAGVAGGALVARGAARERGGNGPARPERREQYETKGHPVRDGRAGASSSLAALQLRHKQRLDQQRRQRVHAEAGVAHLVAAAQTMR